MNRLKASIETFIWLLQTIGVFQVFFPSFVWMASTTLRSVMGVFRELPVVTKASLAGRVGAKASDATLRHKPVVLQLHRCLYAHLSNAPLLYRLNRVYRVFWGKEETVHSKLTFSHPFLWWMVLFWLPLPCVCSGHDWLHAYAAGPVVMLVPMSEEQTSHMGREHLELMQHPWALWNRFLL